MEVYKSETREVIGRFLLRQLSFPDCIAALDAALAAYCPGSSQNSLTRFEP
jgi:hypothetical protein